jgi:hypothetical protein
VTRETSKCHAMAACVHNSSTINVFVRFAPCLIAIITQIELISGPTGCSLDLGRGSDLESSQLQSDERREMRCRRCGLPSGSDPGFHERGHLHSGPRLAHHLLQPRRRKDHRRSAREHHRPSIPGDHNRTQSIGKRVFRHDGVHTSRTLGRRIATRTATGVTIGTTPPSDRSNSPPADRSYAG